MFNDQEILDILELLSEIKLEKEAQEEKFQNSQEKKSWSCEIYSVWDLHAPAWSFENLKDLSWFLQTGIKKGFFF